MADELFDEVHLSFKNVLQELQHHPPRVSTVITQVMNNIYVANVG